MNKKLLIILAIVAAVIAVPLLQARLGGGVVVEVQVEKLAPRSIQSSVLASGRLVHEEEVKLTTEEIGKVTEIYVGEGDHVTRGQLVLQIDDQRHRAVVEQNEAAARVQEIAIQRQQLQVESLRTQWERMRGLHERNLIDEDSFVTATNNLEIAEVDLRSSRESSLPGSMASACAPSRSCVHGICGGRLSRSRRRSTSRSAKRRSRARPTYRARIS